MFSALAAGCALGPARAFGQDSSVSNPALDFQIPFEATQSPLFYFNQATFEPYVGGIFRGRRSGRTVTLQLLKVKGYAPAAATRLMTKRARVTKSFTLTFEAAHSLTELSDVHTLEHAALGEFSLLMTRYEDARGRVLYEAVFNHVH